MPVIDISEITFDTNDVLGSLYRSPQCTTPGKAEFRVEACNHKPDGRNGAYYATTLLVTAHEDPSCVGQELFVILNLAGKMMRPTLQIGLLSGAITVEQLQQARNTGQNGLNHVQLDRCLGQTFYGEIKKSKPSADGTVYYNVYDFYGPNDPRTKNFPRSKAPSQNTVAPAPARPATLTPEQTGVPVVSAPTTAVLAPVSEDDIPF